MLKKKAKRRTSLGVLRYPTRCQVIEEDAVYESRMLNENNPETVRDFTRNIKKIEYPDTIIIMTSVGTYMRGFRNEKTESIRLPKSLKILDDGFLRRFYNLKNIYIYKDIEYIGDYALSSSITTIRMQGKAGSIIGAPWGADNATVNWNCDSEQ
ncbi:copper amine oxidase N-terminal domain protein [Clostridium sp. CAG:793]|nr:copper amine oxidase N-terminal domain protein [Clostridium sp. CAG:793]